MDSGKYTRNIELMCPTCGGVEFEYDDTVDGGQMSVRCISCNREMTKDELMQENSENISEHVSEIKEEVFADAAKEFKESLINAFKGNKNIKIR